MGKKLNNEHQKETLKKLSSDLKTRKRGSGIYVKSKQHKKKLSEANKGIKPWNNGLKGEEMLSHFKDNKVWNKGIKGYKVHTEEHKEELRKSMTGNKFREGISPWNKGKTYTSKPCTEEMKIQISNALKGHPCYKDKVRANNISEALKKYYVKHPEAIEKFKERRKHIILPVKDSSIEVKIQNFLKVLGIEFFTHQYMKEIEHSYQCDILIPSMNMVIECDGDYWHKYPIGLERDHVRTKELITKGFKVLRLWERDIRVMDVNQFESILKSRGKI